MLLYTGGWVGDYFEDTGDGDDALSRYVGKMARLPQVTPLGDHYSYSNSGFNLAGRVIEAVTRRTYEAAAAEIVLKPLGMKRSFYFPKEVMLQRFVSGHRIEDGRPVLARPWPLPRSNNAAGGVTSSVRDQLRYARFHLGCDRAFGMASRRSR